MEKSTYWAVFGTTVGAVTIVAGIALGKRYAAAIGNLSSDKQIAGLYSAGKGIGDILTPQQTPRVDLDLVELAQQIPDTLTSIMHGFSGTIDHLANLRSVDSLSELASLVNSWEFVAVAAIVLLAWNMARISRSEV